MLRIEFAKPAPDRRVLRLSGRLMDLWVDELRRSCQELLGNGVTLALDLSDVSFVDHAGVGLLSELIQRGVLLMYCPDFVREQLRSRRAE